MNEQVRGVLTFWDVIPKIKGDSLQVEIMTPHQKHYYQEGKTPHDSGQPVPISFLTVPPGSEFAFLVQCDLVRLEKIAPELAKDNAWKKLLEKAFEHAFDWCGFGAKTAVGYGAMIDRKKQNEAYEKAGIQKLVDAGMIVGRDVWVNAILKSTAAGSGEITVQSTSGELATGKFYSKLSDSAKKQSKKGKQVFLDVTINRQANMITIESMEEKST